MKQFFFDDQRLFDRCGLERRYGEPEAVAFYNDPNIAVAYCWTWVLKGPDGLFHLIYSGYMKGHGLPICAAAVSEDGRHFRPRNTAVESGIANPLIPNQLLDESYQGEVTAVIEDPSAPPEMRYKILFADVEHLGDKGTVDDYVLVSPDLIHFSKLEDSCWNACGTEPSACAFYNPVRKAYSILTRPDCGQRRVAYTETTDWHHYTEPELCMQCDSSERPLAEIYGVPCAFYYDGMFIGFPLIYSGFRASHYLKFSSGTMEAELAYSLNGRYWQRSLRTPFVGTQRPCQNFLPEINMIWPMSVLPAEDGKLLLYAAVNAYEHGTPKETLDPTRTGMIVFELRKDGFIGLFTDANGHAGSFATRELVWQGGEPMFNLDADEATCAVYEAGEEFLAEPKFLPGFSHADCIPFHGSSTEWTPQWKDGQTLEQAAKGKVVVIELKLTHGAVWSLSGDFVPVMTYEAIRYRKWGTLPNCLGF